MRTSIVVLSMLFAWASPSEGRTKYAYEDGAVRLEPKKYYQAELGGGIVLVLVGGIFHGLANTEGVGADHAEKNLNFIREYEAQNPGNTFNTKEQFMSEANRRRDQEVIYRSVSYSSYVTGGALILKGLRDWRKYNIRYAQWMQHVNVEPKSDGGSITYSVQFGGN